MSETRFLNMCVTGILQKNTPKYTKMYLKYIYFMLSILQIHLHIYVT